MSSERCSTVFYIVPWTGNIIHSKMPFIPLYIHGTDVIQQLAQLNSLHSNRIDLQALWSITHCSKETLFQTTLVTVSQTEPVYTNTVLLVSIRLCFHMDCLDRVLRSHLSPILVYTPLTVHIHIH